MVVSQYINSESLNLARVVRMKGVENSSNSVSDIASAVVLVLGNVWPQDLVILPV